MSDPSKNPHWPLGSCFHCTNYCICEGEEYGDIDDIPCGGACWSPVYKCDPDCVGFPESFEPVLEKVREWFKYHGDECPSREWRALFTRIKEWVASRPDDNYDCKCNYVTLEDGEVCECKRRSVWHEALTKKIMNFTE